MRSDTRDNPQFQRDMLVTVENVVGRMNGLMLQLPLGTTPIEKARPIDLRQWCTHLRCEIGA